MDSAGAIEIRDGDAVRHTREDGHHRQLDITETRQASRLDAQTIHIEAVGGAAPTDEADGAGTAPDITLTHVQFVSREGTTLLAGGDITVTPGAD